MSNEIRATGAEIDWPVFMISGGFIVAFVGLAIVDIDLLSDIVNAGFSIATTYFGAYWQGLLLLTFLAAILVCVSPAGRATLGGIETPEMSTFKWVAIIMCTLLAGGGVFWAAAEPIAHFTNSPPLFSVASNTPEAVAPALAQSFLHWGFLAWSILGSLTAIVLMYYHYERKLPLKPRTLLYPIFGERILHGWAGALVDACCVIAVVSGTVGPIGFLGLQISFSLSELSDIANNYTTQLTIILALIVVYTLSAVSGVTRGIQLLSSFNVLLSLALILFILLAGPTEFIVENFLRGSATQLQHFFAMTTYREDVSWLNNWTVFFWGWFLGYGPLMALFIARISRGRTIRELIVVVSVIAPLVTNFWFTIVGGTGIYFELVEPGVISGPFAEHGMPAALLSMTQQLPFGLFISVLFLILTTIFVATTGDSMTYTVSMVMTGTDHPRAELRVFWGIVMGVVAAILISIGSGGISALQSFIVVTAMPVSLILLPSLWYGPKIAWSMHLKEMRLKETNQQFKAAE